MPDDPTPSSSASQAVNLRKGFLARLSSPFAPSSRTVIEFTVQADDPHRRYSPGDTVTGSVILKLAKATRITHIAVCLHGYVQVYRTPGAPPAEGFRSHNSLVGQGKANKRGAYFGNGFASLFEQEKVLCGDGRLEEGNYKFEYNVKFPDQTLPSSIDFERGTVSYMVSATLTRPNSMTPILFDDQKIYFTERIDVAQLLPPKPRTINLEPLLKRSQTKSSSRRKGGQGNSIRFEDGASISREGTPRSVTRVASNAGAPRSPSPSVRSLESHHSSQRAFSEPGSAMISSRASDLGSIVGADDGAGRTITITVESLKGGTLRGDQIPLNISVRHTKHVKSLRGIIVTLYRQARVDTHPSLPVGPTSEGDKRRFEDYYPKSLTGLGGLSLSGAGSSHLFRKDLSQVVHPLIVDPNTLVAELRPKVRVPDDAFPTIACVPGAMISFKYYLEVIIDIQGKLAGSDKYTAHPSYEQYAEFSGGSGDATRSRTERLAHGSYAGPVIDTTAIRRDKTVVSCVLEVVIGTEDSERRKGKTPVRDSGSVSRVPSGAQNRPAAGHSDPSTMPSGQQSHQRTVTGAGFDGSHDGQMQYQDPQGYYPGYNGYNGYYEGYDGHYDGYHGYYEGYHGHYDGYNGPPYDAQYDSGAQWNANYNYDEPPEFFAPEPPLDNSLSEKDRLRQAEAALLPSEPPPEEAGPADMPSVPVMGGNDLTQQPRRSSPPVLERESGPAAEAAEVEGALDVSRHEPSAQVTDEIPERTEKDELRRRELEQQASAPEWDRAEGSAQMAIEESQGAKVPNSHELERIERGALTARAHADPDLDEEHLPRYER